MSRKFRCFFLLLFLSGSRLIAQNASNYAALKGNSASLIADRNGNPVSFSTSTLISNNFAYSNSNPQPIGFDFYFMGNRYTHFVAGSSGVMALALSNSTSSILDVFASNDLTRTFAYPPTTNNAALLAPFWDFLRTAPVGYPTVRVKTVGTAPLRTTVIEWQVKINLNSSSSQPDGIFQVRLYESTGIVEYVYGKMAIGSGSGTVTASIGFTAGNTDNRFMALKSLSTYQFTTTAVEEPATQSLVNSNVAQTIFSLSGTTNGSLTNFTFTPNAASGSFSQCFATNINFNSLSINWADNISNESGFALYRSTDNTNFEWVANAPANASSINVTGLNSNTTYYWRVVAIAEGNTQTRIELTQPTRQCSMTGTYSIGPGGNFPTIQAAIDTAVQRGVSGSLLFELNAAYSATAESFPIYFRKINCAGPTNSITLRPASGVRGKQISTNLNLPVFNFTDAAYYRIDGRPGGTDTASASLLMVENSGSGAGDNVAIQVEEHSRQNIFRWLQVRGANTDDSSGVFKIIAQTAGTGNDSLLIENCFLGNSGSNYPKHLLFLSGNGFAINDGIRVLNNNFFNHLTSGAFSKTSAIYAGGYNNRLLIRGNSFYQTAAVDINANRSDYYEVYVAPSGSGGGHVVDSNFLGGSAPRLGGQKMRMRSTLSYCGIFSGALPGNPHTISDNTIGSITCFFTDDQREFVGIGYSGTFNGRISGNTIGSTTVDSSIAIGSRFDAGNVVFEGIAGTSNFLSPDTDSTIVENNKVSNIWGGIGFTGNVRILALAFSQLRQLTLRNNLVGSIANNRSIVNTTNDKISGIYFSDAFNTQNLPLNIRISGNTVAGCTGLSTGVWNIMNGMQFENADSDNGSILVSGNDIRNLFSASGRDASTNLFSSLAGISTQNKLTAIERNTIRNLQCLSGVPSGARIAGIEAAMFNLTAAMDVARIHANRIYGLGAGGSTPVSVEGIRIANANAVASANMVYLGTDVDGATITTAHRFAGIATASSYNCAVLNNSVAIVGNQVPAGTQPNSSYALLNTLPRSSTLRVENNLLTNFRSSSTVVTSFKHYAIGSDSAINPASQSFNGNLYYASGTNSMTCRYLGADIPSLSTWRNTTSVDEYSISANPNFRLLNGAGGNLFDLHLESPTPAEATGIPTETIDDFDGDAYLNNTPYDIGADAGNFTAIDVSAPRIEVPNPLDSTGRLGDRLLQSVRITDNKTGVDNYTANTRPAIWFRKKNGAVSSNWASNFGTLTSGTLLDGEWEFPISYSQLNLPVSGGDTIQYYMVAQDTATPINVGVYPFAGANHSATALQLAPPANPLFYRLKEPLPRSITIGRQGRMYTSFTGNNGLFDAIKNTGGLGGNTEVTVYGNITETGSVALEGEGMNGYSLTIRPSAATVSDIRNAATFAGATFRLQNTKGLLIDGRFNGSGRFLRFVNDSLSFTPVLFRIDANSENVLIRNSVLASSAIDTSAEATVVVGAGENRDIELRENLFDASAGYRTQKPFSNTGLLSTSDSNRIRIVGNEFSNQQFFGIYLRNCNTACIIDSNSFYRRDTVNQMEESVQFISVHSGGGHFVRGNFIGGREARCGGRPFIYPLNFPNYFTGVFMPINLNTTGSASNEISGNTIANINIPAHMANGAFYGIIAGGSSPFSIINNLIGSRTQPNSILTAAGSNGSIENIGILVNSSGITEISGNTLSNLRLTNTYRTNTLTGIRISEGTSRQNSIRGNIIRDFYSAGTGSGIGPQFSNASVAGIDVRNLALISGNLIANLNATSTESNEVACYGIYASDAAPSDLGPFGIIERNRISQINNAAYAGSNSTIYGMSVNNGKWKILNNQVLLTNNNRPAALRIYGLNVNESVAGQKEIIYNTIVLGGDNGNQFEFTYAGAVLLNSASSRGKVYDNIFYNNRYGSGKHYPFTYNNYPGNTPFFDSTNANHNLFISPDTTKVVYQFLDNSSLHQWRIVSGADRSSYYLSSDSVPQLNFFVDTAVGNLNLNTANKFCWAANGKALPFVGLTDDYDNIAVRSSSPAGGSSDIGSDEFNTSTLPPFLRITGNHVPGGADTLWQSGRVVAIIRWGLTGILPVLGGARYYSGYWPNDSTNGGSLSDPAALNAWWDIPATGGSGYSYSITLFYDSSILGRAQSASSLLLSKKQTGVSGSWQVLQPTTVNTVAGTITATGLTSFSEFSAASYNAPLAYPGSEICRGGNTSFTALNTGAGYTYRWQVDQGNGFTDVLADAVYSGVSTSTLTISNPPSAYNRYRYRCRVNTGSGFVDDAVYSLKLVNRWTGAVNTAWANTANWSCGQLPDDNTDVVVPAGLVFYPNVTADVSCRSLRVQNGANVTISGNARLLLTGK